MPTSVQAPDVSLDVPLSFRTEVTKKTFQKGDDLLHDPNFHLITVAPMTEYHGWFGPRVASQADIHGWTVRVYSQFDPRVAAAYASAKDGFQANLDQGAEFLNDNEPPYMFARFARKQFRWGNVVSFFSQFTQDTALYAPNNGHLEYEVWGVTHDRRYTVVATVSVSHPKLADWGPSVRDAPSIAALKEDSDYKLVETCSPDEFVPSLTAFDHLVNSLHIR